MTNEHRLQLFHSLLSHIVHGWIGNFTPPAKLPNPPQFMTTTINICTAACPKFDVTPSHSFDFVWLRRNFDIIVLLVLSSKPYLLHYYERASAASERSLFNITEKSQCERPGPARPGPARPETLFRGSYLSNRWAD